MHVTIIAKTPVAGLVKTRLCPPCSHEQAAQVAAAALADTFSAVDSVAAATGARRVLLLDGEPQPWMPAGYEVVRQRDGRLDERLCGGFADLGPGVIIGMETPHAAPALVGALDAVSRGVEALGLATDGGYWMIGLTAMAIELGGLVFDGVPMSSSHTGMAQLRRLHLLGRPVHVVPVARDLDTFDDLVSVAAAGRGGELGAVARRVIAQVG
jgi:hypothetical protein